MNKHAIEISDHLLAKFLDGKTDVSETELVLAWLNENNENLEDFMNIRSAITTESEYPLEIDFDERLNSVKQHIESSNNRKTIFKKKLYLITSFAAAAMIAGVVFLLVSINSENNNITAQGEDVEHIIDVNSDTINEEILVILKNFKNELAENEHQNIPQNKIEIETPSLDNEEETIELPVQIQHQNMAYKTEANLFEMVKPTKTPYIVLCKNLDKTFDFKWKTNAEKVVISLKDKNGVTIFTNEVSQAVFSLKYADFIQYKEIEWELKATFKDGKTEEKGGILQLIKE